MVAIGGVLCVKVNPDGTYNLMDFTVPKKYRNIRKKNVALHKLPASVRDALVVLQILEDGGRINGVGYRPSRDTFWLEENDE